MRIIVLYILIISIFARFKHIVKIYVLNFTHFIKNNHPITIYTHK